MILVTLSCLISTTGCVAAHERQLWKDIGNFEYSDSAQAEKETPAQKAGLGTLVTYALKHNPEVRAQFERVRAATLSIAKARKMPEPTITYQHYLQSVETRVGPQQYNVGLSQKFPWPTKLTAAADAASSKALAAQAQLQAQILNMKERLAHTYWSLWLVHEEHRLKTEHDVLLDTLAGTVRARVKTGQASLADLNQLELGIARHRDHHGQHQQDSARLLAQLHQLLGMGASQHPIMPTDFPEEGLPTGSEDELVKQASQHPMVAMHDSLAQSSEHLARQENSAFFPSLMLGVNRIETGEAQNPALEDSGKDPWIVSAALTLPIWWGAYSDARDAALAQGHAHRADVQARRHAMQARTIGALAQVRDAQRRIELIRGTLLPQATTTYRAVLGSYQTGRSTVASMLLAQRDLLDLRIELVRARALHAKAWAALEASVGAFIPRHNPAGDAG